VSDASVDHATHIVYLGLGIVAVSLIPILRRRQNQGENDSNTKPPQETSAPQQVDATRPTHDESMKANIATEPTSKKTPTGIVTKSGKAFALIACLLLAMFFFWHAIPGGKTRSASERTVAPVLYQTEQTSATKSVTKNIEDLTVWLVIPAYNPEGGETNALNLERPNEATWRKLTFISPKRDGSTSEITLLRPLWWLEEQQAELGGEVWVEVPECGISGWAKLLSIEPCPTIENKDGHVVTGTFKHTVSNVLDIWIEGEPEPIGTTPNHPFWSEDAQAFVRADALTVSTTLRLLDNSPSQVRRIEARPSQQYVVYNLEVHSQHTYFVGQNGVLVHNSNPCPPQTPPKPGDIMTYREWLTIENKVDAHGNKLQGHHPIAKKVLDEKKNGLNIYDSPIVVMTEGDHYKTANFGGRAKSQSTDLVEGIITGFNDGVLQRVVGDRFDELWEMTSKFLGWY